MTRTGLLSSNITKLQIHLETYYTTIDVIRKDKINNDREFETLKIIFQTCVYLGSNLLVMDYFTATI